MRAQEPSRPASLRSGSRPGSARGVESQPNSRIGPRLTREELRARIDALEESYEFFLAYAAQGRSGETARGSDGEVRRFLTKTEEALDGLGAGLGKLAEVEGMTPREPYRGMADVLGRDEVSTLAAVQLVSAQDTVSSQADRQPERVDPLPCASHRPLHHRRDLGDPGR